MSFRARLRLFFALIVILPMIALAIVLFVLIERSETGKLDAGVAAGMRTTFELYREHAARALPALRVVAADQRLRSRLRSGAPDSAGARLEQLVRNGVEAVVIRSLDGQVLARAGSPTAVAHRAARLDVEGQTVGTLSVSVTEASDFTRRAGSLTGAEVSLFRSARELSATVEPGGPAREVLGETGGPRDFDLRDDEFRGRVEAIRDPSGPPLEVALYRPAAAVSEQIADNRLLTGLLLGLFLLFALGSATLVSRALNGQVGTLLSAAKRLARGDFRQPVRVQGHDEFAELGREFNSMSSQLETKIDELERKREELAETIRRVGDALATGLDRHGVVALAVRQAVDGCEAELGRALPVDHGAFDRCDIGETTPELEEAVEAAERAAFAIGPEVGEELLEALEPEPPAIEAEGAMATLDPSARALQERPGPRRRSAVAASAGGAHALSVGMRALIGEAEYLGVLSIARSDREFSRTEEELVEYLAGQAVISIENARLHEAVGRQAVTDDLTGLANVRALGSILEREIERSRRFGSPLGLVMLDLDDFKQVNDRYGHQQGDEVLAQVAGVLRQLSRDIDAPARYGGEEMAMVLPQTDARGAARQAERIRAAIERMQVPRVGGRGTLGVTASFGVASLPESATDRDGLIAAADAALYRAKRAGKNRVERAKRPHAA